MQDFEISSEIRIDLHCHSSASFDGHVEPAELLELARDSGLTHLAITDHDTIEGAVAARAARISGITLIVGQEVRTDEGDLIVLYVERTIPSGLGLEETVSRAREQGAVVGLAHPFDAYRPSVGRGAARPADLTRLAALVDYVEIHNGRIRDEQANARAAEFARQYGVAPVAVSDAHRASEVGAAYAVLQGSATSGANLLAALGGPSRLVVQTQQQDAAPAGLLRQLLSRFGIC